MTNLQEKCTYVCGPYKGYHGRAEYDVAAKVFHGEVIGTRDVITFAGHTIGELRIAFKDSVDDYLAFCAQRKQKPEKPFSGKFMIRLAPELHRKISAIAETLGTSLNQLIAETLESVCVHGGVVKSTDWINHPPDEPERPGPRRSKSNGVAGRRNKANAKGRRKKRTAA